MHLSRNSTHFARSLWSCVAAGSLTLVGCKTETKVAPSADAGAVSEAVAPTPSASLAAAAQSALPPIMDIPGRFQFEASHRPKGALSAEQVFDAIAAQGEVLTERKQHLGDPFGAAYCQGAKAMNEKHFYSVCEYGSEAAAEKGLKDAEKFGTANRKVIRNGSSTLIMRWEAADTSKAEQIFRALKAPDAKP